MRALAVASLLCAGAAVADVGPPSPPVPPVVVVDGEFAPGFEAAIPIAFFALVFGIFVVAQLARIKREGALHETVRLALERGVDVDVSSVLPPPRNDRRRGILLVSLGLGLFAFLLAVDGIEAAAMGLVPAFLGFGYFAVDRAER